MKVCLIQPHYSLDFADSDKCFADQLELMRKCDDSMDLIVMPESADVPAYAPTREQSEENVRKFNAPLLEEAARTARRCHAILCVNARDIMPDGSLRNTTFVFDRDGNIHGKYYKQHLVPSESAKDQLALDSDYSFEWSEPTVIEIEGLRLGFLVCYDFYFYEAFANMARQNLDIIIGCSHQRSDTHQALDIMCRFLAYNTNAYVCRASISLDESSDICGGSTVVAPDGTTLLNMRSRVGLECVDIDPTKKYFKPAGFGNPPSAHYEYIEKGRRPWKYRPAGSAIVLPDDKMPYPRVCAHRGFSTIAPENSMPAFGAAVALGADEIEFDLHLTKDGRVVSIHDSSLYRVSTGEGKVYDKTYAELMEYDFGVKHGEQFRGLKIPTFEEILKKFSSHVVMNVHIKHRRGEDEYNRRLIEEAAKLIRKYDCVKYCYFMISPSDVHRIAAEVAPDIPRCQGEGDDHWHIVDNAIANGCEKVQFFKPFFDQRMIEKAHEHGIKCNVFWSDDPHEAQFMLNLGIDTILTNDYQRVASVIKSGELDVKR